MEPMAENKPAGGMPEKLDPLGRIKNRSSASVQRAPQYSVPDIQPEPQAGFLIGLRSDEVSRCVRRPFRVIQSVTYS